MILELLCYARPVLDARGSLGDKKDTFPALKELSLLGGDR